MIAYTLGSTKSYDEALSTDIAVNKIGRSEDYSGGWVWKTKEEAFKFLTSSNFLKVDWGDGILRNPYNFSIYSLLINDWDTDTYIFDENHNCLTIDAKILSKEYMPSVGVNDI